jgi:hypothetical protein
MGAICFRDDPNIKGQQSAQQDKAPSKAENPMPANTAKKKDK